MPLYKTASFAIIIPSSFLLIAHTAAKNAIAALVFSGFPRPSPNPLAKLLLPLYKGLFCLKVELMQ